ncbi:MAG: transglycosylase domain-containing protein [Bacteroidia bacterium]|nr:penicillin-binding protein [Bacteroidia bacterium]MDW8157987.1 transglycosylase domain-containing protein [Bacteroidia bacterium]
MTNFSKLISTIPAIAQKYRIHLILIASLFLGGAGISIFFFLTLPNLDALTKDINEDLTIIYSSDGVELGRIKSQEYQDLALASEIPDWVYKALVVVEDPYFYAHSGWNLSHNLKNLLFSYDIKSTLSQKLARALYQNQHIPINSFIGNLKVLFTALFLEWKFSKKEILHHYLNQASFGGAVQGIKAAALQFFNKKTQELTPAEAALLIGMLRAPTRYHPIKAPERALARRNEVLQQMVLAHILEPTIAASLIKTPIRVQNSIIHFEKPPWKAPYFLEYVKKWLFRFAKVHGFSPYGLRVHTTLNYRLQIHAEKAVAQHLSAYQQLLNHYLKTKGVPWEKDPNMLWRFIRRTDRYKKLKLLGYSENQIIKEFEKVQPMRVFQWQKPGYLDTLLSPLDSIKYYIPFLEAGLISINQNNGNVVAWVGGIDYTFFKYDHVGQGKRQVGSTFKPFVYAAAFEAGYVPCDTLLNQPLTIIAPDGQKWRPQNADFDYGGAVSLRYGLVNSINVVAARLIQKVGTEKVVALCRRLGIEANFSPLPSIALGTVDLSVAELTYAYLPFTNGGLKYPFNVVSKIENIDGEIVYEQDSTAQRVLEPKIAHTMLELLRKVTLIGTAGNARSIANLPYELDIGGKTGTTQNNSDAWFVGFTPEAVTGVWVGCAERGINFGRTELGRGSFMALPIWSIYMHKAYNDSKLGWQVNKKIPGPDDFDVQIDCYNDPIKKVIPDSSASEFDYSALIADTLQKQ